MSKSPTASERQLWRFERLVAVAQSAYLDSRGALAMCVLQVAWLAAEDQQQFSKVIAVARIMLDHPIDGIDQAILQDLVGDTSTKRITPSA